MQKNNAILLNNCGIFYNQRTKMYTLFNVVKHSYFGFICPVCKDSKTVQKALSRYNKGKLLREGLNNEKDINF